MLRRFNIWKSVGKETFKEVPGQLVMRGIKGVSLRVREIKSYLCNIYLIQLHLKSPLKTFSLTQNTYSKRSTLNAKQVTPASDTPTRHRVTDTVKSQSYFMKICWKGRFGIRFWNGKKKKITGIKLMFSSTEGIFIPHPNHTDQSLNYAEEAEEGPPMGFSFWFSFFLHFSISTWKKPTFQLDAVY